MRFLILCFALCIALAYAQSRQSGYQIGSGIYDITGPAAEVGMMGYAMMNQRTSGIFFRLRARAFVISDGDKRVVFVNLDTAMLFNEVKAAVIKLLQAEYGNLYTNDNVMISAIHTHSGPGGFSFMAMYDIMSWGFHKENFLVIVNGIYQAIVQAHNSMTSDASIYINSGELLNSNINRSPTAYDANPEDEKALYKYNVDKLMTLIRFQGSSGEDLGMINWFAVHGTSMNNTNEFINGDNKGYAAYLFEKYINGNTSTPGVGPFLAAFAQTNEGDVSPNTRGAFCDDGTPCEVAHSTCNGKSQGCKAYGPGVTDFDSCRIIGTYQFQKAIELFFNATETLDVKVDFIHTFVDMSSVVVNATWTSTGQTETTCEAALGDSFAAGTTDGPGDFDFQQGSNNSDDNPFWNFIADQVLSDPTQAEIKCHYPKPILINAGDITFPSPWAAKVLPLQIFRLGDLFIVGVPGEFTTMSGRRLRDAVRQTLQQYGVSNNSYVVIAGLANAYSHYITTYEEYQIQRYEGASTLFGPHTLAAYQQLYSGLVAAMLQGQTVPPGPTPPELNANTPSFQPGVVLDATPFGKKFGDVNRDASSSYYRGGVAVVSFWGANPRNDFRIQESFTSIEMWEGSYWQVVAVDGDVETKWSWQRVGIAESLITVEWDIPLTRSPGQYRIRTFGTSKDLFGTLTPYSGTSRTFSVY